MNMLLKKNLRCGWPSGLIGLFIGFNLVLALVAVLVPTPVKAIDTCGGSYPCFTPRGCEAAHGTFIACPAACPGAGVQRGYCYARSEPIPLTVSIGGLNRTIDLGEYIQAAYNYGVAIAGIVAAVMMMIGGIQWLTAGTSDRVSAARKRILDATIGLALTVFAWFILNTINPALVILQMPRIPMVKQERLVRCDLFRLERSCGVEFGVKANEDASDTATERERFTITETNDPDILTTCVGKNCAGVNDCTAGGCTCQRTGASASATPDTGTVAAGGTSSEWECRPCIAADQECQGLGPSDGCCGGYCGAIDDSVDQVIARTGAGTPVETTSNFIGSGLPGSCSSGMHGLKCGSAQECVGGYCVDASDYFQAFTGVRNVAGGVRDIFAGAYRLDWTEIVQGLAQLQLAPNATVAGIWAGGICSNGSVGALCNNNEDCAGGNHCIEQAGIHVCSPSIVGSACSDTEAWGGGTDTSRTPCPEGSVCDLETNRCVRAASSGHNYCAPSGGNEQCVEWFGESFRCDSVGQIYTCISGQPGTVCTDDQHCRWSDTSGVHQGKCNLGAIIDFNPDTGICTEGLDGNGCYDNGDCVSGVCFDFEGWGKTCIGPNTEPSSPCVPDGAAGQCGGGMTCDPNSHTCISSTGGGR